MLNIISNEIFKPNSAISGPGKVYHNLIQGLEKLRIPYVINANLDYCEYLWIYNDATALKKLAGLNPEIKVVVGPSFILPRQVDAQLAVGLSRALVLQPSLWTKEMIMSWGWDFCPIDVWPVGIDLKRFAPIGTVRDTVLVYFKQRDLVALTTVEKILKEKNIRYEVIVYGKYDEKQYQSVLARTTYIIWLGRQESQGIALEEALAMNVPMIVIEPTALGDWAPANKKDQRLFTPQELKYAPVTAAPYFDERCGLKIEKLSELPKAVVHMQNTYGTYQPRAYIQDNLSLEKQAQAFIDLYKKHWPDSRGTVYTKRKSWKNRLLWSLLGTAQTIVNKLRKGR
jgi:hypothetical protein